MHASVSQHTCLGGRCDTQPSQERRRADHGGLVISPEIAHAVAGVGSQLATEGSGYKLTTADQSTYAFNAAGQLTARKVPGESESDKTEPPGTKKAPGMAAWVLAIVATPRFKGRDVRDPQDTGGGPGPQEA
ncbi:hypothetical protein ACIRD9_41045, partial [Streptomyces violaceus]|uniref:hypothetical protein n=1 Tax=Streptomyces violaceus TaxID=1936 RepID=UPI0037FC7A8B